MSLLYLQINEFKYVSDVKTLMYSTKRCRLTISLEEGKPEFDALSLLRIAFYLACILFVPQKSRNLTKFAQTACFIVGRVTPLYVILINSKNIFKKRF